MLLTVFPLLFQLVFFFFFLYKTKDTPPFIHWEVQQFDSFCVLGKQERVWCDKSRSLVIPMSFFSWILQKRLKQKVKITAFILLMSFHSSNFLINRLFFFNVIALDRVLIRYFKYRQWSLKQGVYLVNKLFFCAVMIIYLLKLL